MKFVLNTFLGATLMHTQFLRLPYFAGENKRFSAKIVKFPTGPQMCLVCAQQKKILSQNKVYDYVLFWYNYHLSTILTH